MLAFRRRFVDKGRSPASQTRIRKKIPDRRVRISNRGDHHKPDSGKSANISARFWAISSAEGAGPVFRKQTAQGVDWLQNRHIAGLREHRIDRRPNERVGRYAFFLSESDQLRLF